MKNQLGQEVGALKKKKKEGGGGLETLYELCKRETSLKNLFLI